VDERSADTTIAIRKRVDGLELSVEQSGLGEDGLSMKLSFAIICSTRRGL
jgi:hypothetical protein